MRKNLKHISKSLLLILGLAVFAVSCENDDVNPLTVGLLEAEIVDVQATVTLDRDFVAEEDDLGYTVSIDQALPSDASLRLQVTFDDDRRFSTQVPIAAGETSASGVLVFRAADNFDIDTFANPDGLVDFVNIQVTGGILSSPEVGKDYRILSDLVEINLIDGIPTPRDTAGYNVTFTWEGADAGVDFDMYEFNIFSGEGATGAAVEVISTSADEATEGSNPFVYNLFFATAVVPSTPPAYRAVVQTRATDGSSTLDVFTGTLDGVDVTRIFLLLDITKTTDADGNVSFVATQGED